MNSPGIFVLHLEMPYINWKAILKWFDTGWPQGPSPCFAIQIKFILTQQLNSLKASMLTRLRNSLSLSIAEVWIWRCQWNLVEISTTPSNCICKTKEHCNSWKFTDYPSSKQPFKSNFQHCMLWGFGELADNALFAKGLTPDHIGLSISVEF